MVFGTCENRDKEARSITYRGNNKRDVIKSSVNSTKKLGFKCNSPEKMSKRCHTLKIFELNEENTD